MTALAWPAPAVGGLEVRPRYRGPLRGGGARGGPTAFWDAGRVKSLSAAVTAWASPLLRWCPPWHICRARARASSATQGYQTHMAAIKYFGGRWRRWAGRPPTHSVYAYVECRVHGNPSQSRPCGRGHAWLPGECRPFEMRFQ